MSVPEWLAYFIVFAATAFENVFPPTPSDVIVALAGFLSHHRVTTPWLVFLFAWSGGMLTSGGVYSISRRHGRRFFAGPVGRRLLPAKAVAAMEREYHRFGTIGLFLARLIPGVRTFVAPFAGLVDLPPSRVMVPIGLASALWYAALTWVGMALGAEWESIVQFIGRLNVGLALFGVVLVAAVVIWRVAARRRNTKRELLAALEVALTSAPATVEQADTAMLLLEIARDEDTIGAVELAAIESALHPLTPPVAERAHLRMPPLEARSTDEVATAVATHFGMESRVAAWQRLRLLLARQEELASYRSTLEKHAARLLAVGAGSE